MERAGPRRECCPVSLLGELRPKVLHPNSRWSRSPRELLPSRVSSDSHGAITTRAIFCEGNRWLSCSGGACLGMHLSARYYDQLQDFVHQSYGPVIEAIQSHLDLRPGVSVLEIGCGTGQLAKRIVKLGCQYTGLEPDSERVQYAQSQCPEGRFLIGSGESIDPSELADVRRAFIHGVLHHMDDRQCRTLISHLMSIPDMRLLVIEPFLPEPAWRWPLGYLLGKMDEGIYVRRRQEYEAICEPWLVSSKVRSLKPRWPVPFVHLEMRASV